MWNKLRLRPTHAGRRAYQLEKVGQPHPRLTGFLCRRGFKLGLVQRLTGLKPLANLS